MGVKVNGALIRRIRGARIMFSRVPPLPTGLGVPGSSNSTDEGRGTLEVSSSQPANISREQWEVKASSILCTGIICVIHIEISEVEKSKSRVV